MLSCLVYISTATKKMSYDDLVALGHTAAMNNIKFDITGLLLYEAGTFLQILEGGEQHINTLFELIKKDPRNKNVILLIHKKLDKRNFPHWNMKVKDISEHNKLSELSEYKKELLHIDSNERSSLYISIIFHFLCTSLKSEYITLPVENNTDEVDKSKLIHNITPREKQVLRYLVEGYTAKKIARLLNISYKTAARHTENMCKKNNCSNKSDLIVKVFESGYLKELIHSN